MRLFTAIDIPASLREALSELQDTEDTNALSVRWTDPEQVHVTLRFIGDVSEEEAVRYEEALATVDVDPVRCVPQQPSGLDVLPSRQSPRVLVLGLERTDSMMTLYEAVSEKLESEGVTPEGRTYRPHVTIGRLDDPDPKAIHNFLRSHDERTFSAFEADRFVLYESTLSPDGAIHEPQAIFPLEP